MTSTSEAKSVSRYVADNANKIIDFVRSYPPEQRAARFGHVWRSVGKDRDAAAVAAAQDSLTEPVIAALKEGRNVRAYHNFVAAAFESGRAGASLDKEWESAKERQNSIDLEKLQVALGQAQNALAKEGIRVALMSISEHYWLTGDFQNAMKHIGRIRETCSTAEHTAAYCMQAFQFAAFQESGPNLSICAPYVQRLEQVADALSPVDYARAKIASGLIALDKRHYRQATQLLTGLRSPALAGNATTLDFAAILEPIMRIGDFAQLLALLALSQLDRPALEKFLSNPDFKVLFETEAELRGAVTGFHECHYYDALSKLAGRTAQMRLDLFLAPHATGLLQTVRSKAIRQFVAPFVTVQLSKMATVFRTTPAEVEKELALMIRNREIDARIDKTRGALQAAHADQDEQAALKAAALAQETVEDTEMALRVLSMYRNGVVVQPAAPQVMPAGASYPAGAAAAAAAGGAAAQPY